LQQVLDQFVAGSHESRAQAVALQSADEERQHFIAKYVSFFLNIASHSVDIEFCTNYLNVNAF
jgi:hypothetical protein